MTIRRVRKLRVEPGVIAHRAAWTTECVNEKCSNPDWVPDPGAMAATASGVYVLGGDCHVTHLVHRGNALSVARSFVATSTTADHLLCKSMAITRCGDIAVLGWAADPTPFFFVSVLSPKGEPLAERQWRDDDIVQDFAINRRTGDMHILFDSNPVVDPNTPSELRTFTTL